MYKIGELSRLCALPVKTLRYYDAEGLLVPDHIDRFTGYRYYSAARLGDCHRIVALKALGFSLEEIRTQMQADSAVGVLAQLEARAAAIRAQMAEDAARLRQLEAISARFREGEEDMMHMIIRPEGGFRAALVRDIYSTRETAEAALEALCASLPASVCGRRRVVINYETAYREKNFDLAVGVELCGALPYGSEAEVREIGFAAETASVICPRERLEEAYRAMLRQLDEGNVQITGPFCELCHEDGTVELKVSVCRGGEAEPVTGMAPFVDDPAVVGRWTLLDILPSPEQFCYGHPKCPHSGWLDELYFLADGGGYWALGGWTAGEIYTCTREAGRFWRNRYTVRKEDGHTLLYLEMQDFRDGGAVPCGMPEIWVYEKADSLVRHADELRRRDVIDLPHMPDDAVLGDWRTVDFVISRDQFVPGQRFWKEEPFLTHLRFAAGGKCRWEQQNGVSAPRWTAGAVLFPDQEIAAGYELVTLGGREYLFVEWKTGDYTYGGGRVYWHVMIRDTDAPEERVWADKVDLPFVADDALLGRWAVVDFCAKSTEEFHPGRQNRPLCDLHLRSLDFAPDGRVVQQTKAGRQTLGWTRGRLLCAASGTAPAYEIRRVEGKEYLFVEWKGGDYIRGGVVHWYVLTRA